MVWVLLIIEVRMGLYINIIWTVVAYKMYTSICFFVCQSCSIFHFIYKRLPLSTDKSNPCKQSNSAPKNPDEPEDN